MKIDLAGKTAIITGGTRGIGRSIASLFSKCGAKVIVTGTKKDNELLGTDASLQYMQLDLQDQDSIRSFLTNISDLRSIEILINNAGINIIEPIDEIGLDNWENILRVNLTGPLILTREISKKMKIQRYGRIVNISSILGVISRSKRNSYSASKAGLLGLTRSVALDLAEFNILVNAVCPGFTKTELTFSILTPEDQGVLLNEIPVGRFAEVDEIAKTVLFLASDLNTYITGQSIIVDGGYTIK